MSEYQLFLGLMLFFGWLMWLAIEHWKAVLVIVVALFLSIMVLIGYGVAHALDGGAGDGRAPQVVRVVQAGA